MDKSATQVSGLGYFKFLIYLKKSGVLISSASELQPIPQSWYELTTKLN